MVRMLEQGWGDLITVKRVSTPKMIGALKEDRVYRSCDVGAQRFEYRVPAGEWATPEVRRVEDEAIVVKLGPVNGAGYPIIRVHLRPPGIEGVLLGQKLNLVQPQRRLRKADRDIQITLADEKYVLGWRDKRIAVIRADSSLVAQRRRQWRLTADVTETERCLVAALVMSSMEDALDSPLWDYSP